MKKLFYLLFVLLCSATAWAQQADIGTFKRARLYLSDYSIVKASKMTIKEQEVSFFNVNSKTTQNLPLSSIELVRVPKGSYVLEGALFGGGTLALTALLVDLQPDPLGIETEKDTGFYLSYTAVGVAIGAVVGLLFPKWKLFYSNGKFVGSNASLQVSPDSEFRNIGVKIRLGI
ncbi:MAG: hypothetical protein AB3N14_05065 [Flavobacteriaceae bacterium]